MAKSEHRTPRSKWFFCQYGALKFREFSEFPRHWEGKKFSISVVMDEYQKFLGIYGPWFYLGREGVTSYTIFRVCENVGVRNCCHCKPNIRIRPISIGPVLYTKVVQNGLKPSKNFKSKIFQSRIFQYFKPFFWLKSGYLGFFQSD